MKDKKIFIDTSSLIKRYVLEKGSDKLDQYFCDDNCFFISHITNIEFNSALKRRLIEKSLSLIDYNKILYEFYIDFPNFKLMKLDNKIEDTAIKLIKKYQMKTLDSIQLSSGIISKCDYFITSDKNLFKITQKELKKKTIFIG